MREVIVIGIGQAGTQLSSAIWELLCLEHAINSDGYLFTSSLDSAKFGNDETFFHHTQNGKRVPHAVIVDLEPTVIDEIRTGVYRNLFHPDQLISSMEDASSNFARGFYSMGRHKVDTVLTQIRRATEACDTFQGFLIVNGFGGGTGSGFTSLMLNYLSTEYTKCSKIQMGIYPGSQLSTGIMEPYNTVLAFNSSMEQSDVSLLVDNESLYNLCDTGCNIWRPSYTDINRILAVLLSSLTASSRFESPLNVDLTQLETNLVPYPRIHFPMVSYAPMVASERFEHDTCSVNDLTRALFDANSQTLSVDLTQGKIITCCIQYRGNITMQEANRAIIESKYRRMLRFTDWCPTGIKLGISNVAPTIPSFFPMARTRRSALLLMNNSAVNQAIEKVGDKFDMLYQRRAFVHWFVSEGMEETEFTIARKELSVLVRDYLEVTQGINSSDETNACLRVGEQQTMNQPEDMISQSYRANQTSGGSSNRIKIHDMSENLSNRLSGNIERSAV
ncbi:Tubulin alpha chain [Fasciola gigantica]|uniref:Tubulin alpha chain n=1 Tax=Fasciola gigantica TaxID=46835 RepID=A0A504Y9T1_FASGI|nr:Tubulin alpha chain [Fasciola gigantica]